MATNWSTCGFCDTKHSVVWCSECDEGLCGVCKNQHAVTKATKNHETVCIAKFKMLPHDFLQIVQTCKRHNEEFEMFCAKHDCPCCKKCIRTHNDCKGLTDINDIIKNVKTSNALYEIEQNLTEVVENIKRISTNRKENVKSLEYRKREIDAEIKQARTEINQHIDKLRDGLIEELMTVEQNESIKIEKLMTNLKKKKKSITEIQDNFSSIKQHAFNLQTFLTMKYIEKDIAGTEQFIQSITKSGSTNQVNISFQMTKSLQKLSATVQKFGDIIVSYDPSDYSIQKRKDRQAQIRVATPTRNIDNMTLTFRKGIDTKSADVYGCSLLPDDSMIFSSYFENKLRVLKSEISKDFLKLRKLINRLMWYLLAMILLL